ncbi:MAG TPA: CZB domain-containing protein [Holophagaceae bacterium]|nr:CZB domain-containing protein [Holophagaceae bacterium]
MDFQEAMAAHRKWKAHLRLHIDGSSTDRMDPDLIGREDLCDLGCWIQGEGGLTMAAKPEFQTLRETHARFHQVAAEVLRLSKDGDPHGACLALDGPFYRASVAVMEALEACRAACVAGGHPRA